MENIYKYLSLALIVILAFVALYVLPRQNPEQAIQVADFRSCQEAGYTVTTSFPATCHTPDGRRFVQDVNENPEVVVESPKPNDLVTSPLTVKGKARGFWYFEANLPVTLKDQNGNVLAQKGFQAKGEWMTEDYVEFEDTLTFTTPTTEFGTLVISKDNASGLPEFDKDFSVPVRFK